MQWQDTSASTRRQSMLKATFVMEQHLGHGTFYQNLRRSLHSQAALDARWVEVTYEQSDGWHQRFALLPQHIRGTLSGRSQVRQGLSDTHCDVTFFNTQVPAALAGKVVRGCPYVLCTDITPLQYDRLSDHYKQPKRNGVIEQYKHRVNRSLMQQAAHLVPWSTWVKQSLIRDYGVQAERITVVPPGVELNRWRPAASVEQRGPLRILFVGGDFQRKGGDTLLEAFHRLPAGAAELILVTRSAVKPGDGIIVRNDLQANSLELIALYQSCHLFALPTRAEAFGIALLEASATGLPVVATSVGGVTDIVRDGETGLLVEPDNVEQLTAALQLLLENPTRRQQMGQQARRHVEHSFDADKNAAKILRILEEVVNH